MPDDKFIDGEEVDGLEDQLIAGIKRLCFLTKSCHSNEDLEVAAGKIAKELVSDDIRNSIWSPSRAMIFDAYLPDDSEMIFDLRKSVLESWLAKDDGVSFRQQWIIGLRELADRLEEL